MRLGGAGREQARRQRSPCGGIRQERRPRRQRDAVHAGLPDDALSAQLQDAELRPAEGFHRRSVPPTKSMLSYNIGPMVPAEREDAERLRRMVQGQSRQGRLRHHLGRRHAALCGGDVRERGQGRDEPGALSRRRAGAAGRGRRAHRGERQPGQREHAAARRPAPSASSR